PIANSAAAAIVAMAATSSAATGCSKNVSPLSATARTYCTASSVLQPVLASAEISRPGASASHTRRVRSASARGLVAPDLDLERRVAARLHGGGGAQVGGGLGIADHAKHRDAIAHLAAEQRMRRAAGGAADEVVQRDLDRRLGGLVAVHAAVHRGGCAGDVF